MPNYLLECEIVGVEASSYGDNFIVVKPRIVIREFNGKEIDSPWGILIGTDDKKKETDAISKVHLEKDLTIKLGIKPCWLACRLFSRPYSSVVLVLESSNDSQKTKISDDLTVVGFNATS